MRDGDMVMTTCCACGRKRWSVLFEGGARRIVDRGIPRKGPDGWSCYCVMRSERFFEKGEAPLIVSEERAQ